MKTCIDCHFLALVNRSNDGGWYQYSWDANDRAKKEIKLDRYAPECHKQVWSTRTDPTLSWNDELGKNRRKCSFFVPYERSMSFPAAIELLDRKAKSKSNKINIIGIIVAAVVGLFVGLFL